MATSSSVPLIGLSSASVYPESTAHAFGWAAQLGYDAVEVMVGIDSLSQQVDAVKKLSDHHQVPICAVHAPCLLFTQRVWGTDPWVKLERSAEMADAVGADVVVVHPPFRWQKDYAAGFVEGIASLEARTGIAFAVENMYPWRASSRRGMEMYLPGWDPSSESYANTTIDLSHAAIARSDVIEMADRMGDTPAPHPPHRRHRLGQGRAPRARPRGDEGRGVPAPPRRSGLLRPRRARDQHPAGRQPEPSARPTCGSRWSSPARTSPYPRHEHPGDVSRQPAHVPRPAPRSPRHPGRGPRRRAGVVRREGLPGYDDPRRRGRPPVSTPRSCTTTSAARTTSSSPRWRCPSTPASSWLPWSPRGRTAPGSGSFAPSCRRGTIRRSRCGCWRWSARCSARTARPCSTRASSRSSSARCSRSSSVDRPEVRVPLVASQVVGLIVTRYLLALPPMAEMSADDVVARVGPVLQHYLTGDLPVAVVRRPPRAVERCVTHVLGRQNLPHSPLAGLTAHRLGAQFNT